MNNAELIKQAARIKDSALIEGKGIGAYAQAVEFLKTYLGADNAFLESLNNVEEKKKSKDIYIGGITASILEAFVEYVQNGLLENKVKDEIPAETEKPMAPVAVPERDMEEKLLDKAKKIINETDSIPFVPALLAGTALEFFLKKLVKKNNIDISGYPATVFVCGRALMQAKVIKQEDMKNISHWGEIFEKTEKGNLQEFYDMEEISIMLNGIRSLISSYEYKVK